MFVFRLLLSGVSLCFSISVFIFVFSNESHNGDQNYLKIFLFQDWDPTEVLTAYDRTLDEDEASDGNLILLAYEEFVQDLAQILKDVCNSNFLQLELIVTRSQLLDLCPESSKLEAGVAGAIGITPSSTKTTGLGFFDRICTGIACDVVGTSKVLQSSASFLNNENPFATILSFHRTWRMRRNENKQRYKTSFT